MSQRRKNRVLVARKGQMWWENEEYASQLTLPRSEDFQLYDRFFNTFYVESKIRKFLARRESIAPAGALSDQIDELRMKIRILEAKVDYATANSLPLDVDDVLEDIASEIGEIEGLEKAYYKIDGTSLDFFLLTSQFTSDFLDRVSRTEIAVSRKYPNMSIRMQPLGCEDQNKEMRLHLLLVKK